LCSARARRKAALSSRVTKFSVGAELAAKLRERSIIVRHFRNPPRIADFLRITVGTDEQCAGLVDALREIVYTRLNK
jgi:histidinol-phosphate/aromatic aminotransferase/cobyric acid decarboxylase-like protein